MACLNKEKIEAASQLSNFFPLKDPQIFLVAANWSVYSRLEQPQLLRKT